MQNSISVFSAFFSVFLTLAFVLFLAWFFLRCLGKSPLQTNSRYIRVIDRVVIDRDRSILLVSAGDKTMLIAMTSGSAQTLCEFTPEEQALYFSSHEPEQDFSAVLKQFLPKYGKGGAEND